MSRPCRAASARHSSRPLPVPLPRPADRVREREAKGAAVERPIALAAMILFPRGLMGVLREVARGDAVVLADHHATEPGEVALHLVRATLIAHAVG